MSWPDDPNAPAPEGEPPIDAPVGGGDYEDVIATTPDTVTYANGAIVPRGVSPIIDAHARRHEGRIGNRVRRPEVDIGPITMGAPPASADEARLRAIHGDDAAFAEQAAGLPPPAPDLPTRIVPSSASVMATGLPQRQIQTPDGQWHDVDANGAVAVPPPAAGAPPAAGQPVAWRGGGAPMRAGGGAPTMATRTATMTETQRGTPVAPEIVTDAANAQAREQQAASDAAAVRGQAAQRTADLQARTLANAQATEAQQRQNEADRQAAAAQSLSDYRDAVAGAEQRAVDPDHWYASRGTGGQILAALAVGLGTLGSGIAGTHNDALALVQDAINRDMQAQRENMANAQEGVAGHRGILESMRERFGDERQAEAAAMAALYQNAETEAKQIVAQSGAEGAAPEAEALVAQLAQQHDEWLARVQAIGADRVTIRQQSQTVPVGGGGARQFPSVPGAQPTDVAAGQLSTADLSKVRAEMASYQEARQAVGELEAMARDGFTLDPEKRARAEALRQTVIHGLAGPEHAGALGDRERESYERRVPNPTEFQWSSIAGENPDLAIIRALGGAVERAANARLHSYGWSLDMGSPPPGAPSEQRPAGFAAAGTQ